MVNYYSTPIPGIGASFHNLITDESQSLANKINQTKLQTVEERIADFEIRLNSPGIADILGTFVYAVIIFLLAAAQAIAIVVIAFGFIATAVCVLVGPIFIPFFIVPKLILSKPNPPDIKPGRHCKNPHVCEFYELCNPELPEHHVSHLPRISAKKVQRLLSDGVRSISDIPDAFPVATENSV